MLVILSGLPGVGKTAIARELALQTGAVHLRIDSIEQAIRALGDPGAHLDEAGYRVAYAVAADNLRVGRIVIADSVNPIQLTRDAWRSVAADAMVHALEIEVVCTDAAEHRCRLEKRVTDMPESRLLTWEDVLCTEYAPWNREHLVLDTANKALIKNIEIIRKALNKLSSCVV
jgi:predicted kinase